MQFSIYTKRLIQELRECIQAVDRMDEQPFNFMSNTLSSITNELEENEELLSQQEEPKSYDFPFAKSLFKEEIDLCDDPFEQRQRKLIIDPLEQSDI